MQAVSRHRGMIRWSLLFCALFILFLSTTTFVLNHSRVHDRVVQHLKTMGLEVDTLHFRLVPTPTIEVSDLVMRDVLTSEPTLRAARASLSLRLWPLLTKRVAMVTLHAIEPEVVIRRDDHGHWHLPLREAESTDTQGDVSRDRWMLANLDLSEGRLRILDANRLTSEGIEVHHVQALVNSNSADTQTDVMLTGTTNDGGNLDIAGTLTLQPFDRSNGSVTRQFDGTVRFHNWDFEYWLERTGQSLAERSARTAWRGSISAGLHVAFPSAAQGFHVVASEISADVGWLLIHGQLMIESAGTDHPSYAVNLSTSAVTSEMLFANIPRRWVPDNVQAAIDEHELAGTIALESVALRGKLDVLRVPDDWHMMVKLLNASANWRNTHALIRNLSATVSLDPEGADISNFSGDMNGVHVTSSQFLISNLGPRPTLDAQFVSTGSLEQVLAVLERFSEGSKAHQVLRTVRNATGTLRLAVHLNGPILPKPSLRLMSAEMSLQDMGAQIAKAISIGQVNGTVAADSRLVGIRQVQGVFQGIHFEAQGHVDMESPPRVDNLRIKMSADGTAIQELLSTYLPATSNVRMEGPAQSIVSVSGTAAAVHCHGKIDVTEMEMSVPSVVQKKKGIPGLIEWEGRVFDGKRVIVDRLRLALPDGELRIAGQVALGHTPKFHFTMTSGPISFRALAAIGINTPVTEGILETSAVISGEGANWRLWTPSGWVSIRRAVVNLPGLEERLSEVSGRLQVTRGSLLLDELSFRMGESDVKMTGIVERWRTHPRATFLVESSQLKVSNFVPKKTANEETTGGHLQDWIKSKEAAITFLVKELQYERLVLKTVSGEIKLDEHKAKLEKLQGETAKGALSGRLEARFGTEDQVELAADMSVDGIPAQQVLSPTGDETEHLKGNLSLTGVLQARLDNTSPLQNTISTGRDGLVLKVTNGSLQQDPVLSKVLKILNLPAVLFGKVDFVQDEIPFHSLSARVIARNGVFSSENIVLDSPVIRVTGAGAADVKDNGLDLALAVSPVAAYADLIGRIPLFDRLFGGDHQGLTTALFQAKGTLGDPDIAYLPLESLGRGLAGYPRLAIDVLVNTIHLPRTALAFATE